MAGEEFSTLDLMSITDWRLVLLISDGDLAKTWAQAASQLVLLFLTHLSRHCDAGVDRIIVLHDMR